MAWSMTLWYFRGLKLLWLVFCKHVAPVQTDCHAPKAELCLYVKWAVPVQLDLTFNFETVSEWGWVRNQRVQAASKEALEGRKGRTAKQGENKDQVLYKYVFQCKRERESRKLHGPHFCPPSITTCLSLSHTQTLWTNHSLLAAQSILSSGISLREFWESTVEYIYRGKKGLDRERGCG